MSEADIPGYEAGLSEVNVADSSHADEVVAEETPVQSMVEDEWQMVPFPHSVPEEHFPEPGNQPVTRDVVIPVASPNLVNLVQELQQHNSALQNRITQLENAIITGQNTLQVEVERSHQQETLLTQRHQELAAAQERIDRLFQELGSSHQSIQRQQILIETLTAQLESSQERIAQLERECALTQQRHHDQVQLLLHAEDACRDLRARLHRQQRYTLQFKAALEKCLEVSGANPNYFNTPEVLTESWAGVSNNKRNFKSIAIQSFIPKTQPVQPWSVQSKLLLQLPNLIQGADVAMSSPSDPSATAEQPHQREWQILQALRTTAPSEAIVTPDLANYWAMPAEPPVVEVVEPVVEVVEKVEPALTELLFEDDAVTTESLAATADESVTTSAVADLAIDDLAVESDCDRQSNPDEPFTDIAFINEILEQQALLESLPLLAPELERQIDRIVQSFMAEPGNNDDTLWEDLARLIGFPADSEVLPAKPLPAQQPELEPEAVEIPETINVAAVNDEFPVAESIAIPEAAEEEAVAIAAAAEGQDTEGQAAPSAAEIPDEPVYETGQVINFFQKLATERKTGILPHSSQAANRKVSQSSRFLTVAATLASEPKTEAPAIVNADHSDIQNRHDVQDPLFQSSAGPSPIVYPLRPAKKLKSLAAVQLPSFPRLG
jgi:hypothetical protein